MFGKAVAYLKANLHEFKEFAFKGNLIQLAIGVVLGAAFGNVIGSLVKNLLMPLINLLTGGGNAPGGYLRWEWKGIAFGAFLGDLVQFLIVAVAIFFLMVKVVGWLVKLSAHQQKEGTTTATTKTCPYCLNTVPLLASRCGFCTSDMKETPPPAASIGAASTST
jgi:large conductance mechanosensitive channel